MGDRTPDTDGPAPGGLLMQAARRDLSRSGSNAQRDTSRAQTRFTFNGAEWIPFDVVPTRVPLPILLEATDPADAQAMTVTITASRTDPINNLFIDPVLPIGRGPWRFSQLSFELGSGGADDVEIDVCVGQPVTAPTRYVRAYVLDYSADLVRSVIGPEPGFPIPQWQYVGNAAPGVRVRPSRRTQLAYMLGSEVANTPPLEGADQAYVDAFGVQQQISNYVATFIRNLGGDGDGDGDA